MINVRVATSNTRGFLINLFEHKFDNISFIYEKKNLYEVFGRTRGLLASVIKWRIFDLFGTFRIIKPEDLGEDAYFSYNRFLSTEKPYYVLLENPSALVNYCWNRPKHIIARKKLTNLFRNENMRIVCMSQACFSTFYNLYNIPRKIKLYQVYPLIPDDMSYSERDNKQNCSTKKIECLFISSDFNLKGGADLIEVFKRLNEHNAKIHLTCITRKESLTEYQFNIISKLCNIDIIEFNLNKEELNEYYKRACILLNPTRADSFSLVTLEAIKYGCAVIATDVYAIKEMAMDGYNGFVKQPLYRQWDSNGFPNKYYLKHKADILSSKIIDNELVEWMYKQLVDLENDRAKLLSLCNNSLALARGELFSENSVAQKWEDIINNSVGEYFGRNSNTEL